MSHQTKNPKPSSTKAPRYLVRKANLNDIDGLLPVIKELFDASPYYGHTEFSEKRVRESVTYLIVEDDSKGVVLLVEDTQENTFVGCMVCFATTPLFTYEKLAIEFCLYIQPEHRNKESGRILMDAYEQWAELAGCSTVQYGVMSTSPEELKTIYEKRDAKPLETLYYKKIRN